MKEKEKLDTLLGYWIEHNQEHSREFREWAEKANSAGALNVGKAVKRAADDLDAATASLREAQEQLKYK